MCCIEKMNLIDQIIGNDSVSESNQEKEVVIESPAKENEEELQMEVIEEEENEKKDVEVDMDATGHSDNRLDGISDHNEVVASGVIVHKFDAGSRTMLTLMVRGGRKLDIQNFPQFICYEKELAENFNTGDHVQIHGHNVNLYSKKTESFSEGIVADKVERTPSRLAKLTLEQGLGSHRDFPTAEFYVAGTIRSTELRNNILRLVIRTKMEGEKAIHSTYYMYPRNIESVIPFLKQGRRICAVGEVQTKKIEREGEKTLYQQHNVISDIQLIDDILSLKK